MASISIRDKRGLGAANNELLKRMIRFASHFLFMLVGSMELGMRGPKLFLKRENETEGERGNTKERVIWTRTDKVKRSNIGSTWNGKLSFCSRRIKFQAI